MAIACPYQLGDILKWVDGPEYGKVIEICVDHPREAWVRDQKILCGYTVYFKYFEEDKPPKTVEEWEAHICLIKKKEEDYIGMASWWPPERVTLWLSTNTLKLCQCDISTLVLKGCKCGGL